MIDVILKETGWYPDNYFHFEVTNLFNDVLMSKTLLIFELLVQF